MGCLWTTIAAVLISGEPVPPTRLAEIRNTLEKYLTRIKSIHIKHTEEFVSESPDSPLAQEVLAAMRSDAANRDKALLQMPEEQRKQYEAKRKQSPQGIPKLRSKTVDYLDSFPLARVHEETVVRDSNGQDRTSTLELFVDHRKVTLVDFAERAVREFPSVDRSRLPRSVLNAIGLRLHGTINTSLAALLENPGQTTIEGQESIGGEPSIVLQIGPHLPEGKRSQLRWNTDSFAQVWLAPNHNYLPIRSRFCRVRKGSVRYSEYELEGFHAVKDVARNEMFDFPSSYIYDDQIYKTRTRMESVEVNPLIGAGDFDPVIPAGFVMATDGEPRSAKMIGGSAALAKRVEITTAKAKSLLNVNPSNASTASHWETYLPYCLVALPLFGGVVFYLRRHVKSA